jgi:hypothetical protein
MIQRLPCSRCGDLIHPEPVAMSAPLCMTCKGECHESINNGGSAREQAPDRATAPEAEYWNDLVARVGDPGAGLPGLSPVERTWYAVRRLIADVHDGGIDQFFSGSSGALYALALDGLFEMDADASAALLVRAKEILFGDGYVPLDRNRRLTAMSTTGDPNAGEWRMLEELDKAFRNDPDGLGHRCNEFARSHSLYGEG